MKIWGKPEKEDVPERKFPPPVLLPQSNAFKMQTAGNGFPPFPRKHKIVAQN
jgi:hypothetical protein